MSKYNDTKQWEDQRPFEKFRQKKKDKKFKDKKGKKWKHFERDDDRPQDSY